MNTKKNVIITYHRILQRMWKSNNNTEEASYPFYMIKDVFKYVKSLGKKNKFYELKNDKFCFIDSLEEDVIDNDVVLYKGYFKSARSEFRPNLINKVTGNERKNPKEIMEGDIEKTHFVVKVSKIDNEVYLLIEKNYYGITSNNFINYISEFTKSYMNKNGISKRFSIIKEDIPVNNFLTELERLQRTVLAEVYVDKKLLGSDALEFSNRIISLKKDIMITARAMPKETITEFGIDLFNKMNGTSKSAISRIRVRGVDENSNSVLLDTLNLSKKDNIEIELNTETGEVMTSQLLNRLKKTALDF